MAFKFTLQQNKLSLQFHCPQTLESSHHPKVWTPLFCCSSCSGIGRWQPFQDTGTAVSCVPFTCLPLLHHSSVFTGSLIQCFLRSGTAQCSGLILVLPCLRLGFRHSPKDFWFLLQRDDVSNLDLAAGAGRNFSSAHNSSLPLL